MYYTRVTNTDNRACVGEFHRGCAATCARSSLPDELEFLAADKILSRESCDAHHVSGSKSARVYECLASSGLNERHSGILVARRASDAAQDKSRRMINKNGGFRGRRVYIYIYMGWFEKGVRDIKKNFIRMARGNTSFRVDIRIIKIS